MNSVLFQLNNLNFTFPGTKSPTLENISMVLNKGETVTLLGRSGCGKSTILNLVAGLLSPEKPGDFQTTDSLLFEFQRGLAYVRQSPTLLPYLTAMENAELALRLRAPSAKSYDSYVDPFFTMFDLDYAKDYFPDALSAGMKQRVSLTQQLILGQRVLLLDEPLTALDSHMSGVTQEFISHLIQQREVGCILVTHDLEQVVSLSHRVYLMKSNPGRIAGEIAFDESFKRLSPAQRKESPLYSEYLLTVVKQFGATLT